MEIVGAPDIRTPAEARAYLVKLRTIVRTIGVSSGNMEEGAFRCDANISLRPKGSKSYGTKAEVKNMNSFRSVQRALEYEIERQTKLLRAGERVIQETRGATSRLPSSGFEWAAALCSGTGATQHGRTSSVPTSFRRLSMPQ